MTCLNITLQLVLDCTLNCNYTPDNFSVIINNCNDFLVLVLTLLAFYVLCLVIFLVRHPQHYVCRPHTFIQLSDIKEELTRECSGHLYSAPTADYDQIERHVNLERRAFGMEPLPECQAKSQIQTLLAHEPE